MRSIRWQLLIAAITATLIIGTLASYRLSGASALRSLQGRVYVEATVGTPRQLNPLLLTAQSPAAERDLTALLFAGLTRVAPDGQIVPDLATRWSVSPDGRVYTFTLASRVWHDGQPVTADDVLYTVRSVQNAAFPGDRTLVEVWRSVLVDKLDDRTIRFTLSAPFAPFPSVANLPILPAHLLRALRPEQWASAPFSRQPVGAGPYRLYALDNTQAVLVPAIVTADTPLDYLVLRFYPTADAALLALGRQEVNGVATVPVSGQRLATPSSDTRRVTIPLGDYSILTFNVQQPPLSDLKLRQALATAINRQVLIQNVVGDQGVLLETPVLSGTWAADTSATLPPPRRSQAQQLLGELGYRDADGDGLLELDGQPLSLPLLIADTADASALAAEVARQLEAVGIAIDIRSVPALDLADALVTHNFTLAIHRWSNVGADPDFYALWHSSQANGGSNYAGLEDPELDRLLTEGRATADQGARRRIYAAAEQRWDELVPSLPLYQSVLVYDLQTTIEVTPPSFISRRSDRFALYDTWDFPATP